ncbi:MAG: hypothetical protein ABSD96_19830 [Candidatus Korobacteraceae bacterium]|jgi:hypothetical protein
MSAHTLLFVPAAGFAIAATAGALVRTRRERNDKRMRECFKNVLKLQKELNHRKTSD